MHMAQAEQAWAADRPERLHRFLRGIKTYRRHPYRRQSRHQPVVWRHRSAGLLDYGNGTGHPVLVVPSLINRGYILDLMPSASLLAYLAEGGLRPFLLDWGKPDAADRPQSLDDVFVERLEGAFDWLHRKTRQRPLLLGYCMGGTLATALACRRPADCSGLALLAAPWDFHASAGENGNTFEKLAALTGLMGSAPIDLLQTLFAATDPMAVPEKFADFAALPPTSPAARRFVAIEDWLNDGVALSAAIAHECFQNWYGQNAPAAGRWRVAGHRVQPEVLTIPACFAIPTHDRIVPPESALALAALMPDSEIIRPSSGHVGMIAGSKAKNQLWKPLLVWLMRIAAMQKNGW